MIKAFIETKEGRKIECTADYWFYIGQYLYGCDNDGTILHTFQTDGRVTFKQE